MRGLHFFVIVVASMVGFYIAAGITAATVVFGPQIETWVSPVVKFQPVNPKSVYRDSKIAAFSLSISKLKEATPIKYEFFVESKLSDFIPVSAYLCDAKRRAINEDLITHPVGTSWTRHYCFELPATIADKQDFRVTGRALHRRHPLYDTSTPIIPFVVPALKKLSDPDD